ncbi:MAG: cytochrome P460 family protein [Deltaproteobacteria bacterium]|nr:cytochrome P460 family protein [Deltaproteobacteria bacterium]
MRRAGKWLAVAGVLFAAGAVTAAAPGVLSFPKDYRSWVHAKSMVISDKAHALYGFHHVYVSPKHLKTFQSGGQYAEGAELVVPFYEVDDKAGTISQGALKMVAVMKKDKSAKATGGWLWGAFDANGKTMEMDVKAGCYDCHTAKKDRDFVFSEWQ